MLCGLLAPSGGSGQVLGVPLRAGKLKIAERIGYMSQKFSLYNDLRVIDNLKLFGGIYGLGGGRLSRRVGAALELADLVGRRREITRRLPLGIKQRLALACATLHRPSLVFLDEPTSGVDPLARDRFWLVIGELASRGVTAIVTTHYMEEAERCHRLLLMNEGAIATLGRPAELKQQVRAQIGEPIAVTCAALTDALQILKERFRHVTVFGAAVYAYSTQPTSDEQRIKLLLEERGVAEATVRRRQMPFEEVFVHFTRGAEGSDARVA